MRPRTVAMEPRTDPIVSLDRAGCVARQRLAKGVLAMSVTTERLEPRSVPSSVRQRRRFNTPGGHQCLVLSRDNDRSEMLARMATQGGWETTIVCDVKSAWRTSWDSSYALAIVDHETANERTAQVREFAEHVASRPNTLLVVCGTPEKVEEELWARQNGAWMYLPGVGPDADLGTICAEALSISEKLCQATPPTTNSV